MKKRNILITTVLSFALLASPMRVNAEGNPYGGGWANCTWGAWEALYERTGVALPGMGDASQWLSQAQAYGYATGRTPAVGSIAVYNNHVAYVAEVSDSAVYIIEGGFKGGYNERWVPYDSSGRQALQGYIYTGASPIATGEANAPLLQESKSSDGARYNMNAAEQKVPMVEVKNIEDESRVPALTPVESRAESTAPIVSLGETAPIVALGTVTAE